MFIGFIPFLSAAVALFLSLFTQGSLARRIWWLTGLLVFVWAAYHGAHHLPQFATYGAW
jgi:hypothetical protein